jgi:uncharacterized membrane protein
MDSFFKDEKEDTSNNIPGIDDSKDQPPKIAELDHDRGVIAAILSYIPFLCLIPLIQMRDNEQARFHSRQGLVLFLIELLAGLFLIPGLSSLIWKTVLIISLGASVAGIMFGVQGKMYRLPIISDISDKLKL